MLREELFALIAYFSSLKQLVYHAEHLLSWRSNGWSSPAMWWSWHPTMAICFVRSGIPAWGRADHATAELPGEGHSHP